MRDSYLHCPRCNNDHDFDIACVAGALVITCRNCLFEIKTAQKSTCAA
jgi:hypothetical protein